MAEGAEQGRQDERHDRGGQQDQIAPGSQDGQRAGRPRQAAARPRPLAGGLVFDDPLDGRSQDDTDTGWGERPSPSGSYGGRDLDWYLNEKPPHHG